MKHKRTTAMHEQTGEVRNVIIKNGIMYFDLGCATVPVKDPIWKEQTNHGALKFWSVVAMFICAMSYLCYLDVTYAPL